MPSENEPELGESDSPPRRQPPYEDSGEWVEVRCEHCTYTTKVDAKAGDVMPAFCGVCGTQFTSDQILNRKNRSLADFIWAARDSADEDTTPSNYSYPL